MTQSTWLTIEDICERLKICRATWHRWVSNDDMDTPSRIPGLGRLVRYREEDFRAFLASLEGQATDS
ncbi:MAG: helix-turn-helix domain-containing protein [Pseudomonadota bacterium]